MLVASTIVSAVLVIAVLSTVAAAGYTPVAVAVYNASVASHGQLQVIDTIVCGNYTVIVYGVGTTPLLSVAYAEPGIGTAGALQCLTEASGKLDAEPLAIAVFAATALQTGAHVEAVTAAKVAATDVEAVNVASKAQEPSGTATREDASRHAASCPAPAGNGQEPLAVPVVATTVAPSNHASSNACYAEHYNHNHMREKEHAAPSVTIQTVQESNAVGQAESMDTARRAALALLAGVLAAVVVTALWRARA